MSLHNLCMTQPSAPPYASPVPTTQAEVGQYRAFHEARTYIRSLGLATQEEWEAFCRGEVHGLPPLPPDIQCDPEKVQQYRLQWAGWKDWLWGRFLPFNLACNFVHQLGLQTHLDWRAYRIGKMPHLPPKPANIPSVPDQFAAYRRAWRGWPAWLGVDARKYPSFGATREWVQRLHLSNKRDWCAYMRGERKDLPAYPAEFSRDPENFYEGCGWVNWGDFLGSPKCSVRGKILPFEEARIFVHSLGLQTFAEWKEYVAGKRPDLPSIPKTIPHAPHGVYSRRGEWRGWPYWLRTAQPVIRRRTRKLAAA